MSEIPTYEELQGQHDDLLAAIRRDTLWARVEKAEAERDALAARLDKVREMCDKAPLLPIHVGAGNLVDRQRLVGAREVLTVLASDPSSILAERDAQKWDEGARYAYEQATGEYPTDEWLEACNPYRARAEQDTQPHDSETTNG